MIMLPVPDGTIRLSRPFSSVEDQRMNDISPERRSAVRRQFGLAAILVSTGLVMIGSSLIELHAQQRTEMAQATGTPNTPLQATPAPSPQTEKPAEAKPGGTRPTTPAPEPARPDAQAQKDGAKPALPPAPPEKMAPPITDKK
jgi:outer membrane biosynthesis protein TonB